MENDIRVAVILRDKKSRNDSADTLILGESIPSWNAVELRTVTPEHDVISFNDTDAENLDKLKKNMLIPQKEGESFDKNGNMVDVGQDIDLGLMIIKRGTERFTQPDLESYAKILQNNKELLEPYVMHTNVDGNRWKNIPFLNDEVVYTITEEDIGIADDLATPPDNTIVHRLTVEVIVDGKVDTVNHYDVKDGTLIDRNFIGFQLTYPGYKLKDEIDPFTMQYSFTYELHYVSMYKVDNVIDNTLTDKFFNVKINWVLEPIRYKKATTWKFREPYTEADYVQDGEIPGTSGTFTMENVRYGTMITNPLMYVPNISIVNIENIFPTRIVNDTVINIVLRYTADVRLKPDELATYDYSAIKFNKNGGSSYDGLRIIKDGNFVMPEQTFKNQSTIEIRFKWLKNRSDNQRVEITLKYEYDDDAPSYNVSIENIISYAYKYGVNDSWKVFEQAESYRLSVWQNVTENGTSGNYKLNFDNLNRYKEYAQGKMLVTDKGYNPDVFHVTTADDPLDKIDYDYAWIYKDDAEKRKSLTIDKDKKIDLKNFTSMSTTSRHYQIYAISPRWDYLYYVKPTPAQPAPPPAPKPPTPVQPPAPPAPRMVTLTVNARINPFNYIRTGVRYGKLYNRRSEEFKPSQRIKETPTHNPTNNMSFSYTVAQGTTVNLNMKWHPYLRVVSGYTTSITVNSNTVIDVVFQYTQEKRYDAVGGTIDEVHIVENSNWLYINSSATPVDPFILTRTGKHTV